MAKLKRNCTFNNEVQQFRNEVGMKRKFIVGQLWCAFVLIGILLGLSNGIIKAADVELLLGPSNAFNVVRGTSVAGGTELEVQAHCM